MDDPLDAIENEVVRNHTFIIITPCGTYQGDCASVDIMSDINRESIDGDRFENTPRRTNIVLSDIRLK